ncbi:MAG: hypothetical protein WBA28_02460 [Microbacteriaceae bacterium]
MLLILPLSYLAISLGQIHSAVLAAEGGARQAARLFVRADTLALALSQAEVAVMLAFQNHNLEGTDFKVSVQCRSPHQAAPGVSMEACLSAGTRISVSVETSVLLPFVPGFIPSELMSIPVTAEAHQIVSKFAGAGQ